MIPYFFHFLLTESWGPERLGSRARSSTSVSSPSSGLLLFFWYPRESPLLPTRPWKPICLRPDSMGVLMHSQDPWLDGGKGKRMRKSVPGQEENVWAAPWGWSCIWNCREVCIHRKWLAGKQGLDQPACGGFCDYSITELSSLAGMSLLLSLLLFTYTLPQTCRKVQRTVLQHWPACLLDWAFTLFWPTGESIKKFPLRSETKCSEPATHGEKVQFVVSDCEPRAREAFNFCKVISSSAWKSVWGRSRSHYSRCL